jgi:hypothetical protein
MNHAPNRRPQMSLSFMLLMMMIFCVISGAFYYASQVPAIADEVSMMLGGRGSSGTTGGRRMHMIFVMFTYTAPLLLAGFLATILGIWRKLENRR